MAGLLQSENSMETAKENPLVRYWQLIIVLLGIAMAAGSMQFQVNALAQEVSDQNNDIEELERDDHEDDAELATIKATQEAIKDDVKEIKEDIREQDKKLDRILEKVSE